MRFIRNTTDLRPIILQTNFHIYNIGLYAHTEEMRFGAEEAEEAIQGELLSSSLKLGSRHCTPKLQVVQSQKVIV